MITQASEVPTVASEAPILEVRSSPWNFLWHWVFGFLIVPLIIGLIKRASLVLRIYSDRVMLEKGFLAKEMIEIYVSDIRAIEIKQSVLQRILNIGNITIDSAGSSDELVARGIPDPLRIRELVQSLRQAGMAKND